MKAKLTQLHRTWHT